MPASITLTVAHLPASTSFFLTCLQPLNYVYRGRVNNTVGFGPPDAAPDFWITQSVPGVPPGPAHVAFPATSRRVVHEFFMNGMKAGGKVHGDPALRDEVSGYYSAAIIDLDGNSIEAVFRPDLMADAQNAPGAAKSAVGMTQSVAGSKAPTVVSSATKASKAKSVAPSAVGSQAPSAAKSSVSKVPTQARSVAPSTSPKSTVSKAPSQSSSAAPSRAPTQAVSVAPSRAPAQAPSVAPSKAPTNASQQPRSNGMEGFLAEARDTITMAREFVGQARPAVSTANGGAGGSGGPDSHGTSDAIVGTLLGVAAGAALHYVFSSRQETAASAPASNRNSPPLGIARSETAPSWSEERYYWYHQGQGQGDQMRAIEAAPSAYHGSQRLIEMVDNEPTLSAYAETVRPRRRSSFSGVGTQVSAAKTNATGRSRAIRLLEAPPTSYRVPTASTEASRHTSGGRSRASSVSRAHTVRQDEGYGSASETRSRTSHRSSKHGSKSEAPSRAASQSRRGSIVTAIRTPAEHPLPPSRAATWTGSVHDDHSTHSRPSKTVIGKLTAKQLDKLEKDRGMSDVTKSVVSKVKDVDRLDVTDKELKPSDSVSQVGSSRGSRRSRR